jgi:WD40 repeat protein
VVLLDLSDDSRQRLTPSDVSARIVRFSPNGSMLAAGAEDGMVRLWAINGSARLDQPRILSRHQQDVFALSFSPDGSMLASSGRSGLICLWDTETGSCLVTLPGHGDMVFTLTFSADGTKLMSAGRDQHIQVWDLTHYDRHIAGNMATQRVLSETSR